MNHIYNNSILDQSSRQLMQCLLDQLDILIATLPDMLDDDLRHKLVKRTQQLAIEARQLAMRTATESDHDVEKAGLLDLGYSCEKSAEGVRIELPLLLPKRGGDSAFITEPLHRLLSLERDIQRIHECIVVFRHVYGERGKPPTSATTIMWNPVRSSMSLSVISWLATAASVCPLFI